MIRTLRLSLTSKSTEIRNALEQHTSWINSCLANDATDIVQLRFEESLASVAIQHLLGPACRSALRQEAQESLRRRLERIEFPPGIVPAAALGPISVSRSSSKWAANWLDCPVALYFSGFSKPVIAANIPFVDGAGQGSQWREVVRVKSKDIPSLLLLMEEAFDRGRSMKIVGEGSVNVQSMLWDDLVLDESVVRLVRSDFQLFLQREDWYKQHRLPFRRGYLFHGPPGNGKTSVIRAMLSTPGVSGFTINPFHPLTDMDMLGAMFSEAARSTPAVIVLEDLDRCYPASKETEPASRFPLQQLLNHLDGVGSRDGIVVVATANNPGILDAAILRRPGRFDRVVGFQNPPAELREKYLRHMSPPLRQEDLTEFVSKTTGFSFAQLREAYILAGQIALERDGQITAACLLESACMLSEAMMLADRKWNTQVGFRESA